MCGHCETLLRFLPSVARDSSQIERISQTLLAVADAHKFRALNRASRATSLINDALREIQRAGFAFYAEPTQANYTVIMRAISQFWKARIDANNDRRGSTLNPAGKPEPSANPRIYSIPQCWIHDLHASNPARVAEIIDYAEHSITRNNEFAARMFDSAARTHDDEIRRLAINVAHDARHTAKHIRSQLRDYRAINK